MNNEVKREITRLKDLKSSQDVTDASLEKIAERNITLRDLINSGNYIDEDEKREAKKIFENYLEKLDFENYSDLSTLSVLVYNQILLNRVQKTINAATTKDGKTYIADKLVKTLSDLTNQILSLKEKLGIDKEKIEDDFTANQLLKKRFHHHIQENKADYTLWVPYKCSGCGKEDVESHLLRKKVKDYDVLKHPFFSGRFTYNAEIIKDVELGLITNEQAARYLKTSPRYIQWCLDNKGKIVPDTEEKI